jgi:hypothetical protein
VRIFLISFFIFFGEFFFSTKGICNTISFSQNIFSQNGKKNSPPKKKKKKEKTFPERKRGRKEKKSYFHLGHSFHDLIL